MRKSVRGVRTASLTLSITTHSIQSFVDHIRLSVTKRTFRVARDGTRVVHAPRLRLRRGQSFCINGHSRASIGARYEPEIGGRWRPGRLAVDNSGDEL